MSDDPVDSSQKQLCNHLLDIATAIFLLRKTVEEMTREIEQLGKFTEWWLNYTYDEFTQH